MFLLADPAMHMRANKCSVFQLQSSDIYPTRLTSDNAALYRLAPAKLRVMQSLVRRVHGGVACYIRVQGLGGDAAAMPLRECAAVKNFVIFIRQLKQPLSCQRPATLIQ